MHASCYVKSAAVIRVDFDAIVGDSAGHAQSREDAGVALYDVAATVDERARFLALRVLSRGGAEVLCGRQGQVCARLTTRKTLAIS